MMKSNLFVLRSSFTAEEGIQFNVFTGPTPGDIYEQMAKFTENQFIPPYHMFGPYICDTRPEEINVTTIFDKVEALFAENVIFESHCLHDNIIFFYNHGKINDSTELLNKLKAKLKEQKKKFIVSLMPFVEFGDNKAYKLAEEGKIFIKYKGRSYIGMARGKNVSYIDWNSDEPNLHKWLKEIWNVDILKLEADGYFLQDGWLPDKRFVGFFFRLQFL